MTASIPARAVFACAEPAPVFGSTTAACAAGAAGFCADGATGFCWLVPPRPVCGGRLGTTAVGATVGAVVGRVVGGGGGVLGRVVGGGGGVGAVVGAGVGVAATIVRLS